MNNVKPNSSRATDVAKKIISVITGTHSKVTLLAVICNDTVMNTGKHNGITRQIEESVRRPVQWLICLLSVLDGECTTGPSTSTG